jgi:hypothetical protein
MKNELLLDRRQLFHCFLHFCLDRN